MKYKLVDIERAKGEPTIADKIIEYAREVGNKSMRIEFTKKENANKELIITYKE